MRSTVTLHVVSSPDGFIAEKENSVLWMDSFGDLYERGVTDDGAEVIQSIDCYVLGFFAPMSMRCNSAGPMARRGRCARRCSTLPIRRIVRGRAIRDLQFLLLLVLAGSLPSAGPSARSAASASPAGNCDNLARLLSGPFKLCAAVAAVARTAPTLKGGAQNQWQIVKSRSDRVRIVILPFACSTAVTAVRVITAAP
jgi:type IV secretory pathway VirB2 component (pilin)